jgi:hypothetical protein
MDSAYIDFKEWIVVATGLSKDALHIHFALLIMSVVAAASRRPSIAWTVTLLFQLANEVMDFLGPATEPDWLARAAHDVANTMFWPTIALIALRSKFSRRF